MKKAAFLALLLAGCSREYEPPPLPDKVLNPKTLFAQSCAGCHGANGKMGPAPPLNDALFLKLVSDDELRQIIKGGRKGTSMPGFCTGEGGRVLAPPPTGPGTARIVPGPLTTDQVDAVISHLRAWGQPDAALAPYAALLKDEVKGDPKRGMEVYQRACVDCHGDNGQGMKKGPGMEHVGGAINNPAFLALISPPGLRRIIVTGRSDLHMPDYRGTEGRGKDFQPLSPEDVADVAALVLSWKTAK